MSIQRVAVIFDDQTRPETTGVYCLRALRALVDVVHIRPQDLDRAERNGFDLFLQIDDGLDYRWPAALRPSAWWVIDTHLNFERDCAKAADFDLVFAAQRDGAEGLRRQGIASAEWLPLACDPDLHAKHDVVKEYDICFVGNQFPGPRTELLQLLSRHYPKMFVGCCYFEDMARTYSASRLVFNRSVRNDVNMRVFEALACGSLLLTNDLTDNGQAELFRDGVHLAAYRDADEMLDKARFYLGRDTSRERVAAAGRAEALEKHTYRQRLTRLLAEAERRLARVTVAAQAASASVSSTAPATSNGTGTPLGADRSYYEFARPELLAKIPVTARRVLDIGCGAGRLGERLKGRQRVEVVGIELDPAAAATAQGRLDQVVCDDIERPEVTFERGIFDTVVCGDVLEHLRDPETVLHKIREWLTAEGLVVASIPNVRHHSVIRGLLRGDWTYESAGLLDQTHLRFFTRRSLEALFARTGFSVETIDAILGPGDEEPARAARNGTVRVERLHLEGLQPAEAAEFFAYQYLVIARPRQAAAAAASTATASAAAQEALPALGCVLAIRDRPLECLERTLQTYAYQTVQPLDKVLLDYGSTETLAAAYRTLCQHYQWRYVRATPAVPEWCLSDAYNQAVAALLPEVEVVFKSDVDVLVGENVLAVAAERGRNRLCLFSRLSTTADACYPPHFVGPADVAALLDMSPPPAPVDSEGVQAFPRRWFEDIGGFDLAYRGWGYEDSDLRLRAEWSIGVARVTTSLLIHQGHPPGVPDPRTALNRAYYERSKATRSVLRNRDQPVDRVDIGPAVCRSGLRIPRILHQIWVGPKPLPEAAAAYMASWKRFHPEWEVRLWIDTTLPSLQNARLYEQTTILAQKADLLRYELLWQFGGLYVDVDFECLRNLEPLLDGMEYVYADQRPGEPCNAFLGCTPGHPFARRCLERLPERWPWRPGQILEETGPAFLRRTILDYIGDRRLHPLTDPRSGRVAGNRLDPKTKAPLWALHPWVVYPYFLGEVWRPALHPDAYAVHHWQKNWE